MATPPRPTRGGALANLIDAGVASMKPEERPAPAPVPVGGIVEIDPGKTRMNDLHRRSAATMSGAAIEEMVRMFQATGQTTPAKGWRLEQPGADGVEVVLVYGARRRAAAQQLGRPLKVELLPAPPSRRELIHLMHGENRGRLNYLPLEDAREYQAYLDSREYRTAKEMADALGVSDSTVSRVLNLLTLPGEVLELYADPAWLPLVKGAQLASACSDKATRARVIAAAQEWKSVQGRGNPTPTLMKALTAKSAVSVAYELKGSDGRAVGMVRGTLEGRGTFVINLGTGATDAVRRELAEVLNRHYKLKL